MSNTYWNGNGTYQSIADKLEKLVPATGPAECKHIDRFRQAANAYYDIYNNGGGNSVNRKVAYYFPGVMTVINRNYRNIDWDAVEEITESKMDAIIEKVAKKVGLFS